jgi:two-component system, NtrC family, sensor kinase
MQRNKRILIIDDDQGIRDTFADILRPQEVNQTIALGNQLFGSLKALEKSSDIHYELSMAQDGHQGIQCVRDALRLEKPFAVAFIDMKMPGINGAETSKKILALDPEIKIVIVTAYSEYTAEDIIEIIGNENIFYLRKPFNSEEILQLSRVLSNQWELTAERKKLLTKLNDANVKLLELNVNLKQKVENQATLLVQSEKMASIGVLTAGIAHEINNPIAFVKANLHTIHKYIKRVVQSLNHYQQTHQAIHELGIGVVDELLAHLAEKDKALKLDYIIKDITNLTNESIEGVERVANLVKDLKCFSHHDKTQPKKVDINQVIEKAINIIGNKLKHKTRIITEFATLPDVNCYPQKLSQVFLNILVNAIQAISNDGIIVVQSAVTEDGRRDQDAYIEIKIADNGVGIAKEHLNKIFDPFFTTKPVGQGTGLGLNISYDIIKMHHGFIKVESQPGDGTVFTIRLPVSIRQLSLNKDGYL